MRTKALFHIALTVLACAFVPSRTAYASVPVENLPDMHVNAIAQDRQGYLWIGTDNGLFRFNGSAFVSQNLPTDKVISLASDKRGNLWISCVSGLYLLDLSHDAPSALEVSRPRSDLFAYSKGVVFCGNGGMTVFDSDSHEVLFEKDSDLHDVSAFASGDGYYWGGSADGTKLIQYNSDFEPVKSIEAPGVAAFNSLAVAPDGSVWAARANGLLIIRDGKFIPLPEELAELIEGNSVTALIPGDGEMFVCISQKGIASYEYDSGIMRKGIQNNVKVNKLSDITCGLLDKDGYLWIGTKDRGLGNEYSHQKNFAVFEGVRAMTRGKYVNSVSASKDGSIAWVGSYFKGILGFDLRTRTGIWYDYNKPSNALWIDAKGVNALVCDSSGKLWYNADGCTYICTTEGARITSRKLIGENESVSVLCEDKNGAIWGGGADGLFCWADEKLTTRLLEGVPVSDIVSAVNGKLIIACENGIKTLDLTNQEISPMSVSYDFSTNSINCLMEDSGGNLWIGTRREGLFKLSGGTMSPYVSNDSFGSSNISALAEDKQGNIWVTTAYGLSVISPRYDHLVNFPGNELSIVQHFTAKSITLCGEYLLCGGNTGTLFFNPTDIIERVADIPPTVILSALRIKNNIVGVGDEHSPLKQVLDESDEITLQHRFNSFEILLDAVSFAPDLDVRLMYRLSGRKSNEKWTECGMDGAIPFYRLPTGSYSLEIKAMNGEGFCSAEPRVLGITIKTPVWLTLPMILLYLCIVSLILYFVYTNIKQRVREKMKLEATEKELEYEKDLYNMKMNFFGNISHELRTHLTLIYSPLNMLKKASSASEKDKLVSLVNLNTGKLVELVDQLLALNRIENSVLPLNVSKHSPSELISFHISLFESAAARRELDLKSEMEIDTQLRLYLDSDKIGKIMTNLLSNAVKYTPNGGEIIVRSEIADSLPEDLSAAAASDKWLMISVRDNGIGMKPSEIGGIFDRYTRLENAGFVSSGSGIGLHYTSQLVKMHKGAICARLNPDKGMTFTIAIPTDESLYAGEVATDDPDIVNGLAASFANDDIVIDDETVSSHDLPTVVYTTKILLVEDNALLSDFIKSVLCPKYEVHEAADGVEALDMVEDLLPDLIITDVMMPRLDGFTLSKRIKENPSLSHIPIMILTAKTDEEDRLEGYESGADIYITKPFNSDILLAVIDNMVKSRQRLRESLLESLPEKGEVNIEDAAQLGSKDRMFLNNLVRYIDDNLSDGNIDVLSLSDEMCMGRSSLFRKVRSLTGMTPNAFVNNYRLNKAATLLGSGNYRVSEVYEMLGFKSASYFSKAFKQKFGQTPTEYCSNMQE